MASVVRRFSGSVVSKEDSIGVFISQIDPAADAQIASASDAELIEQVRSGSRRALGTLFLRYQRLVLTIGSRILRDRSEAEDIVQDVFLEICNKAAGFDPGRGSVKMWILQYAYSRSLDRRRYLALRHPNGGCPSADGYSSKLSCSYHPQEQDRLTLEERASAIRKALASLSDKQRQVLELVYFQGLLMAEVAEIMSENLGNVRNHYYRGLKKLQDVLEQVSNLNGI